MNEEQNETGLYNSKNGKLDSITQMRIKRDKWLSGIFVSILVILCLLVSGGLYILSKDYLIWSATKHKAESDLVQLQTIYNRQRIVIDEDVKRLDAQKLERLNELATLKESAAQINLQIAQRDALLNSTDEEKKQLDKIKTEADNLRFQGEQLSAGIDKQRIELSQITGKKELLTGQCSDLSTRFANLKLELDSVQKQITERNLVLAESEQANAAVLAKQQQAVHLQQQITDLVNKKLADNDEILVLQQKQATVAVELKSLESRMMALRTDIDLLEEHKGGLKREILELQASQNSVNENLTKIRRQTADAEDLQKQTTQSNVVLRQAQEQLNNEISLLRVESGKLQGEITQLHVQHQKLVDAIAESEITMAAKQNTGSGPTTSSK